MIGVPKIVDILEASEEKPHVTDNAKEWIARLRMDTYNLLCGIASSVDPDNDYEVERHGEGVLLTVRGEGAPRRRAFPLDRGLLESYIQGVIDAHKPDRRTKWGEITKPISTRWDG